MFEDKERKNLPYVGPSEDEKLINKQLYSLLDKVQNLEILASQTHK